MPQNLSSCFIVYHKETNSFLLAKPTQTGNYLGEREMADYFPTESKAYAEVKWLQENDYLPSYGTFVAIPFDSTILQ